MLNSRISQFGSILCIGSVKNTVSVVKLTMSRNRIEEDLECRCFMCDIKCKIGELIDQLCPICLGSKP